MFNAEPMRLKQSLLNLLSRSTATWTFFTLRLGTGSRAYRVSDDTPR